MMLLLVSSARTNLGLAIGSDVQAYDAGLVDIAGLATTDSNFIVGSGSNWVAETGLLLEQSLGLGSIATQAANSVAITEWYNYRNRYSNLELRCNYKKLCRLI